MEALLVPIEPRVQRFDVWIWVPCRTLPCDALSGEDWQAESRRNRSRHQVAACRAVEVDCIVFRSVADNRPAVADAAEFSLCHVRSDSICIDRVQALTGGHEQTVALAAPKAEVGTYFG